MRENIPTATERGLRATRVWDIFMNFDKDKKSLQESEEQYGSCAQSELMQSLDASASQLTADDVEYLEKMKQCRILRDKYYAPKEFIFKVMGIPTISIGDIHLIQAQAKQGKSTLVTILVAVCRCGQLGPVEYALDHPCKVIVFDTEQFEGDSHSQLMMMHELGEDDNGTEIMMFNLRKLGFAERTAFVKQAILREKPTLVIIDGIRDLIADINDSVGCPLLVQDLMQLASEVSCAIISVLHNNPSDGKARGWIGTETTNKSGYSIEVEKSGSVVTVKTPVFRGAPVPEWQFAFGEGKKPTFDNSFIQSRINSNIEKQKEEQEKKKAEKAEEKKRKDDEYIQPIIDILNANDGSMTKTSLAKNMAERKLKAKTSAIELINRLLEREDPPLMQRGDLVGIRYKATESNFF